MKKANKKRLTKGSLPLSVFLTVLVTILVLFISVISVVAFGNIFKSSLLNITKTNSEQSVDQVSKMINTYSETIEINMQSMQKEVGTQKSRAEVKAYMQMMVKMGADISSILICDTDGTILECSGEKDELKSDITNNLSFDKKQLEATKDMFISSPHIQNIFKDHYPWVVTMAKKMWSQSFNKEVYIIMDIEFSSIASYVNNVGMGQHGYCFLINASNDIIYHPQQQLIFSGIKSENLDFIAPLPNGTYVEGSSIYTLKTIDTGFWKIVGVSFVEELVNAKVKEMVSAACIIAFLAVLAAILLIIVFSNIISRPVRSLVFAMKEFEKNALEFQYAASHSISEFNMLSTSFEHMVIRIQQLMDKVKNEEITLRKTELKALQAQINPHFLYNTLDSIQWMCEQEQTKDAVRMVGALAQLFRISISKGNELISIKKEIEHAQSYLVIQSFRYKNQFTYNFNVDEEILNYMCNKITLQPIIENAIYHGIGAMVDEGEIVISGASDGNDIVFSIKDNGVGMTADQCKAILKKERSDSAGIGIKNVNDRIKIYFGEEYGISIASVLDEGTEITIRLPKIENNNNLID